MCGSINEVFTTIYETIYLYSELQGGNGAAWLHYERQHVLAVFHAYI